MEHVRRGVRRDGRYRWSGQSSPNLKFEARNGAAPDAKADLVVDFDHDYDLDRIELGYDSRMMRNAGPAGFAPVEFPFVKGNATSGVVFRVIPDTKGFDVSADVRRS